MPKRLFAVILLSGLLFGCGLAADAKINGMNQEQIASASDADVCRPYVHGAVIEKERQKRGLGDCDPAHFECRKLGYKLGTPDYLQCRQMFMQQAIAADANYRRAVAQASSSLEEAYKPPATSYTNCTPNMSGSVNCRTTGQ